MTTNKIYKLIPEEIEIKRLENVSVTITAFLTLKKLLSQNVFITNKRVIVISSIVPSITLPISIFYRKTDFENSNKVTSLLLLGAEQKDGNTILSGKGVWGIFKTKWTIKDVDIADIVSKNMSA